VSPPNPDPPRPAPPKVAPPSTSKKTGAPKSGAWKTILVVDPDAENRKRVVDLLREAAEEANEQAAGAPKSSRTLAVHEAENGSAAWALVEVVKPDLVVGEILLEGLSGMQLLRRLRERYAEEAPAVIFVTSMSNEVDRYWALRNGATAYVIKPFDDEFLRNRATKFFEDRDDGGLDLDSNWIAET
jgi:CheY-like chemotaxis protein